MLQDGTELTISVCTVPELLRVRLGTGLMERSHGIAHQTPKSYTGVSLSYQMQPSTRWKTATTETEALFLKIQRGGN